MVVCSFKDKNLLIIPCFLFVYGCHEENQNKVRSGDSPTPQHPTEISCNQKRWQISPRSHVQQ